MKFTNNDTKTAFDECKSEFYLLARSITNRNAYHVLGVTPSTITLLPRGTHSFATDAVIPKWDKIEARFGSQYHAWVLVICNKAGNKNEHSRLAGDRK